MSSSSTSPQWKHDVFVSFIEDDVIKTFISNLFKRLNQVGINYFEDDNREGAGQENKDKRLNAICQQTFAFALIVFSKNYVNSHPCLNELVEILNCNRDPELVVIPIFYVDRAKVSEAASDEAFKEALGRVREKERWRSALANGLANGSGERNLIDKIVGRLVNEIRSLYSGNEFIFGPFGSKGGNDWNRVFIKGIDVKYGEFIESVTFEVDEHTPTVPQNDGKSTFKVKLEDREYVTSFAGSKNANNKGIYSLTFRTNKRILGPIGRVKEETKEEEESKEEEEEEERKEEEEYFSVPSDAGEVIEFFWRKEDNFLESVGARVRLHSKEFNPFRSVGLFGKEKGLRWDDKRTHANVRKIIVCLDQKKEVDSLPKNKKEEVDSSAKRFIRSIEFTYVEENGSLGEPKRHVSKRGGDVNSIVLRANEYLTSISGYYDDKHAGLTSLTFRTNIRMVILIGEEKGTYFSSPATAGKIVGFYGYIDEHLCGIGAYLEPISDLERFGGEYSWDDGKFDGVREIHPFVKVDTQYIHGIKFVYDDSSAEGHATYGNYMEGNKLVELDYPREYLTSISGYMQKDGSISSLTFYSNKRRFVNGEEGGTYFWYPLTGSRIIGFYGTWGQTLNFIGVYVEPIPYLYPFKTVGRPIKGYGGISWDDGVHTNVRGFRVTTTIRPDKIEIVESITFMYDDNGSLVEGSRHGGGDESSGEWVMLDFPKERLTRIEGYYMRVDGDAGQTIIQDLIIATTKTERTPARYAPRGLDKNWQRHFEIPKVPKDGRIVGFFGMAGTHLNSIGARLEPYLIVGVLKKKALIHHGRRPKKNEDKKLQAFDEEELPKHEGKECQQRSLKSSPRIATLVYCIGFVWVLLLTWWTFLFFLI